jgi:hypothetical protein
VRVRSDPEKLERQDQIFRVVMGLWSIGLGLWFMRLGAAALGNGVIFLAAAITGLFRPRLSKSAMAAAVGLALASLGVVGLVGRKPASDPIVLIGCGLLLTVIYTWRLAGPAVQAWRLGRRLNRRQDVR